jgi:hypothetical protein
VWQTKERKEQKIESRVEINVLARSRTPGFLIPFTLDPLKKEKGEKILRVWVSV